MTVAASPERASQIALLRGQYRMIIRVPSTLQNAMLRDVPISAASGSEFRRMYAYKIDVLDEAEPYLGQNTARLTAVVHVLDSPLPAPVAAQMLINRVGLEVEWFQIETIGFYVRDIPSLLLLAAVI